MFIDKRTNILTKLRRSKMFSQNGPVNHASNMPLLRSLSILFESPIYKHLVPMGLVALVVGALSVRAVSVINSRASESMTNFTESSPSQQQMQFPEGLDYAKFLHTSRNHSRLPCLLCHRRETNSPRPKLPGSSGHLPCAGCHAQQFSSSDSPI